LIAGGKIAFTSSAVGYDEARKADGATLTVSRVPRPPNATGKVACLQAELSFSNKVFGHTN